MERRYSKQRACILDVLRATRAHPNAETVYHAVREIIPNVSLGTVYRNLSELVASGEIGAVDIGDNKLHYDYNVAEHQHFVCRDCGSISDLYLESDLGDRVAKLGYEVTGVQSVLYGTCPNCLAKKSN